MTKNSGIINLPLTQRILSGKCYVYDKKGNCFAIVEPTDVYEPKTMLEIRAKYIVKTGNLYGHLYRALNLVTTQLEARPADQRTNEDVSALAAAYTALDMASRV